MDNKQILLIKRDRHLRWAVGRLQGRNLHVVSTVEHQHLILILTQDVVPVADWVSQKIGQSTGNIDEHATLVWLMIVDEHPDRVWYIHGAGRLNANRPRNGTLEVLIGGGVDSNADRHRRYTR